MLTVKGIALLYVAILLSLNKKLIERVTQKGSLMVPSTEILSIEDAWKKRQELYHEAESLHKQADIVKKRCFHAPPGSRLLTWYSAVKSYYEYQGMMAAADRLSAQMDELWFVAVNATYGDVLLEWEFVENKGWRCKLEGGHVFEPL